MTDMTTQQAVEALRAAASSLRAIANLAGKDECMEGVRDVRAYANSRANVAEAAIAALQADGREAVAATHGLYEIPAWESHVQAKVGVERFRDQVIVAHCTSRDEAEKVAAALNGQPNMVMPMEEAIRVGNLMLANTHPQPTAREEMSPEFTDSARAAIAWVLYHHQGGSSPVGAPLRFALGMGAHDPLPDWRIAEAKKWAEWANATTADFHPRRPADTRQDETLAEFAYWVIRSSSFVGADLCGGDVQEKAAALGLLVEVQVTEPCCEECSCSEDGSWPVTCYRFAGVLDAAIQAKRAAMDAAQQELGS